MSKGNDSRVSSPCDSTVLCLRGDAEGYQCHNALPESRYANALPVNFFHFDAISLYTVSFFLYHPAHSSPIFGSTIPPDIRRRIRSVLSSSRLTSLQLIQIPPADRHVALILVHAPREALDILRTRTRLLLLLLGSTSITSLRIVETVVHRLRIGVLCRLLVLVLCCWCLWLSRGTATEPAANGVADRRPNCYTAV
jgi:hypothetical protein